MKGRLLYIALMLGIVVLIGAGAVLTQMLFDIRIPETPDIATPPPPPTAKQPTEGMVTEVVIEAPEPSRPRPAPVPEVSVPPSRPLMSPNRPRVSLPPLARKKKTPEPKVSTPAAAELPGVGSAMDVRGEVAAETPSNRRRVVTGGSRILLNDTIQTGSGAKVRIEFDDCSVLSIGENSIMMIDEFVYKPKQTADNRFKLRFTKGVSRLVTGLIAEATPDEVEVHTRMATIGIRGCDLGFTAGPDEDRIYVFELSGQRTVQIDSSTDGRLTMNALTGKSISIPADRQKTFKIQEPGNMVKVVRGRGASQQAITLDEQRRLLQMVSHLPPTRYQSHQAPGDVFVTLKPGSRDSDGAGTGK